MSFSRLTAEASEPKHSEDGSLEATN
jgi:hypothetical protein